MENIVNTISTVSPIHTVDVEPLALGRVRVLAPSMRGRAGGAARSLVTEPSVLPTVTTIDAFPGTTAWGPPT